MPSLPRRHQVGSKPKPFSSSRTAAKRITGRALQSRNDRIKLRDGYRCYACGRVTDDGQVDHKTPLAFGGSEADENLGWICRKPCHAEKSRREAIEAKRELC